ncbi:probable serine/threonine-protein kinase PBL18 [Salvia miltiorrhiza]|uniref:probable serine/threonine-protein kinase PBL18 n=1 Tax=Salvia miltiorrhiza TaxID=226208 RepID=UPI0025ACA70D|nr:probable serine/threonine-protein kinase PBL18 [Salvia miltiorrhiza]XP_057799448.1 probable serine/threonine-protein kinase PBL18 [Salvia miltiorrhiza]
MAIEYEEIRKATKNFESEVLVGRGGFGSVIYNGWIDEQKLTAVKPASGIAVAINKMNLQQHKEWVDEINYLRQLRHPNLVKLIGYGCNTDKRIVVYEFMPKGSLYNHLFTSGHEALPWATRTKVAIGAATALAFLHALEIPVIHGALQSSDILFDGDFNTKLSNFGIARECPTGCDAAQFINIYGAPEYITTGRSSTRSDVYGFGVVLLELMSGRPVWDRTRPAEEGQLVKWARPYLRDERRVGEMMDSRLMGEYTIKEACKLANIALHCVSEAPKLRPTMSEVVAQLEQL